MLKRKSVLSFLLAMVMILSVLSVFSMTASAATLTRAQFDAKLEEVKAKYPQGSTKYEWAINGTVVGWQCHGYARWLSWYVWGTDFANGRGANWTLYKATSTSTPLDKLVPGDVIRYRRATNLTYNHTIFITAISGDTIYFTDCNSDGNCTIKYNRTISKATMESYMKNSLYGSEAATYGYIAHYTPNTLGGGSVPSCTCSTSYSGNYKCTTTNASLNIRNGHGTSYSVIGSIPSGATVKVIKADGSWAHIEYNGISGYASMDYLAKIECSHTYVEEFEALHPHKVYKKCTKCGVYSYTGATVVVNSCTSCVVSVTGVTLNKTSASLVVGGTTTLTATVAPSNASNKNVTWTSSNTSVATVSTSGVVTAKGAGTATITVKTADGSYTATCKITVTVPVTVTSIYISTASVVTEYKIGDALNTDGMKLTVLYSDGTYKIIESGFTLSGFDSATAGTKTVTVSYGGLSTSFTVEVIAPVLEFNIKSVEENVTSDGIVFTVTTTPTFNRVKVADPDALSSYIAYSSKYTVNADGDYVFTLTVPKNEGVSQFAFDGRRVDTNKYSKNYAYTEVDVPAETTDIISVSHAVSNGKIVFTIVTKAGDYSRIKVTTENALSGSLGVGITYTVDANGNYVWTIKTAEPTENTTYAFDMRNATTGKYVKKYYYYDVDLSATSVISASHKVSGGKVIFTVVTKAGNYDRIKVTSASNLSGSLGVGTSCTVDANGNYVWTIKIAQSEQTNFAFDLRVAGGKYLKEYFKYNV